MNLSIREKRTGTALVWTNLLSEPLFTLYNLLAFILYRDLGASTTQIALLTMLKPLVAILSFYWGAGLRGRPGKLKANVLWAGFFMRAPFLLCWWLDDAWYVIAAAVNYMFFYRAAIPAWMEMVRRNMSSERRHRLFSVSSALGYLEGVVLALGCGAFLDKDPGGWRGLFVMASLIGIGSLFVQGRVQVEAQELERERLPLKEILLRPWRDSWQLMQERPDFARFQWGFMVCGFGIMLIQPALPLFAVDCLGISYLEMMGAISIAKGLGFALSAPFWARSLERYDMMKITSLMFILVGFFPLLLGFSIWHVGWLYAAYWLYGVGSSGSHLIWNLSGVVFAGKEESSRYTGVNVVSVGLRGTIAPPLGGWLSSLASPLWVLALGGGFCFYSGIKLLILKEPVAVNR